MKNDNKKAEIKTANQKQNTKKAKTNESAECVILKPVGYPFEFGLMDEDIEITNIELFEEYAREQWLGLVVKENSHLFDQKIIPDYGFEIVKAKPNNSLITLKPSIFHMQITNLSSLLLSINVLVLL